jgi:hypothetical protein
LFTGRGWVPLLEPQSDLPASETAERLAELQRIRAKWAETAAPHTPLQNQGPNRDGLYVSDWKTRTGEFLLTSDTGRVNLWAWCRCGIGDRAARVRVEHWTGDDGMTAFGWVHAKTSCRRLICMD